LQSAGHPTKTPSCSYSSLAARRGSFHLFPRARLHHEAGLSLKQFASSPAAKNVLLSFPMESGFVAISL
jgi:hypothetical protein